LVRQGEERIQMKVSYIGKNDLKVSDRTIKPSRQVPKENEKTGEIRQDRLQLSGEAQRLLEMEKHLQAADNAGMRAEVVERLRRQIQEGLYRPDSREVADKMIAEAASLLGED
jgi:flagellar biosynthesis anti-sigma factor FlgM